MLLKLLYADYVPDLDIREEATEFYRLFLNCSLTDGQLDELLHNTGL